MAPAPSVNLPRLVQAPSPNFSQRAPGVPHLIVVHRPAGSYDSALAALRDDFRPPEDRVSAHVLVGRPNTRAKPLTCAQLVPWDMKAWACRSFNSDSYNLEITDDAWVKGKNQDADAWRAAARLVAFLCARTGIPPIWTQHPTHDPGIVRHYDLGVSGGGHTDPTTDDAFWKTFIGRVYYEFRQDATGDHKFRRAYGKGLLAHLSV